MNVNRKVSIIICLLLLGTTSCSSTPISQLEATAKENSVIYAGPNVNTLVIGRVSKGTKFHIVGRSGETWVAISADGHQGWIQEFFLDIDGNHLRLPEVSKQFNETNFIISAPTSTKLPVDPSFPGCSCAYNLLDCGDFDSQRDAQNCLNYCINITGYDRNFLDGDSNGIACEGLP